MGRRNGRVLIVDDDPLICELVAEELSERGFDCHIATQPQQAQTLLGSQEFDVLITDIAMPQISGLDILAYVKRHSLSCRVVLITGVTQRDYLAQAIMLGAYDYVEKPFKTGDLADVVSRAIRDAREDSRLPAPATEPAGLQSQTRQASLESVRALVRAVEAKDPYTRQHSVHVTYYAVNLARVLGASAADVESIRVASLLHDVGKIGVPDHILIKQGPLTPEEFDHIRRHPAIGATIVSNITLFSEEARLIRWHHERWDGKGYPDGLTGEEIPVPSRIMNVADSIDAMLMERSYKTSCSPEKMLDELARCAETQFAPEIATVAHEWCRTHSNKLILPGKLAEVAASTSGERDLHDT